MQAFHCWEPPSRQLACVPLIASVLAYEVYYGEEEDEETPLQIEGGSKVGLVLLGVGRGGRESWRRVKGHAGL